MAPPTEIICGYWTAISSLGLGDGGIPKLQTTASLDGGISFIFHRFPFNSESEASVLPRDKFCEKSARTYLPAMVPVRALSILATRKYVTIPSYVSEKLSLLRATTLPITSVGLLALIISLEGCFLGEGEVACIPIGSTERLRKEKGDGWTDSFSLTSTLHCRRPDFCAASHWPGYLRAPFFRRSSEKGTNLYPTPRIVSR